MARMVFVSPPSESLWFSLSWEVEEASPPPMGPWSDEDDEPMEGRGGGCGCSDDDGWWPG